MRSEPRDDGRGGRRCRGPKEEHGHRAFECCVERRRYSEVARHYLDAGGQPRIFRPSRERAHRRARAQKLVDHESPNATRGACDENHV